jgi:predicted TIM-barrel fold metal-dependent hydrolase
MSARSVAGIFFDNAVTLNDLLFSGVLVRHPNLKFVCAETGMGWIPFCLDSADYHFRKFGVPEDRPEFAELPSFYFHRQVYATYWFETLDQYHLDRVGAGNLLFETDYPHSGSLEAAEVQWTIDHGLGGITDDDRQRVLWRNAAELYGLADLLDADTPRVA